ncbi:MULTISPECIES: GspH family T2SS minor pseudopilin variant ExeH [Aeromonas]|uniref:GspH family T2SS minor pseudopilin variant ExeH n=1 Tax=Aeromonas TaxID=642 RepID=UPI00051B1C9B|nr:MULTISPECIES: GspH family T2SS minor pseudopilin variant ExeH [Aeromonas]MCH7370205.1 GspH family T2SS minor pseudopilin variant ExeH [Aeromonas sp. MR16]
MRRALSRQSGFTLLEVLLVAMLMGLVATAVVLSMGGVKGDRELDKQARRFMATLQQAQEYAVMDGRLLGLRLEDHGWQFMSRAAKDRKWQALTGDKILGPVELPEEMTLSVELEGFSWRTDSDEKTEQGRDEKERTPQIFIFPGGELTPFVLSLTQQDDETPYLRTVKGDEFGRLTLLQDEEEEE